MELAWTGAEFLSFGEEMEMRVVWFSWIVGVALILGGCGERGHAHKHEHGEGCSHDHDHDHDDVRVFEVPVGAQHLLGLSFVKAERRHVAGVRRLPGRFEWMPGARKIYATPLSGVVRLAVRPPQSVRKGDLLFTLNSPEWIEKRGAAVEAEAELKLVEAEIGLLRRRLGHLQEAGVRNAELEQQLATREAEAVRREQGVKVARLGVDAVLQLCQEGEGGEVRFVASEDGVVERVGFDNGGWVEGGGEVVSVARLDGLWFRADGVASEMAGVRDGLKGFVEPLHVGAEVAAHGVVELGLSLDSGQRIQPVHLLMEGRPGWALPGGLGVLSVVVAESEAEAVALPEAALVADGVRQVVFVRDGGEEERFFVVEVEPGVSNGEWVEVKGVAEGAQVVLDGAYELKLVALSGGAKQVMGHFHADGEFHEGEH